MKLRKTPEHPTVSDIAALIGCFVMAVVILWMAIGGSGGCNPYDRANDPKCAVDVRYMRGGPSAGI